MTGNPKRKQGKKAVKKSRTKKQQVILKNPKNSNSKKKKETENFWKNFIRALDVEPRDYNEITGASGVKHKLLGIGVNDKDKRLVLISDTPSAEHAAMMQVDVSVTNPDLHVVVARPAAFNMPDLISAIISMSGSNIIDHSAMQKFTSFSKSETGFNDSTKKLFDPLFEQAIQIFNYTPLSGYSQCLQIVNQLSFLNVNFKDIKDDFNIDLSILANLDITEADRNLGICPVPLFEFQEKQMETMLSGGNANDVAEILNGLDIYNYFFPKPDEIGLGLVDRGIRNLSDVKNALIKTPELGHPYQGTHRTYDINEAQLIVDQLIDSDRLEEMEFLNITSQGEQQRLRVKTRPSEGLLIKIIKAMFGKDVHFHF